MTSVISPTPKGRNGTNVLILAGPTIHVPLCMMLTSVLFGFGTVVQVEQGGFPERPPNVVWWCVASPWAQTQLPGILSGLLLPCRWSKGGFEEASEGGWLAGRVNPRDSSPVTMLSPPAAAAAAKQQQAVLPVLQVSHSGFAFGWDY
jgi:hypothetical protein